MSSEVETSLETEIRDSSASLGMTVGTRKTKRLTHISSDGRAQMVDVSAKVMSERKAVATGKIRLERQTLDLISKNQIAKDRKSTRLNSSHSQISYAVFCLKKKKNTHMSNPTRDHTTSQPATPRDL